MTGLVALLAVAVILMGAGWIASLVHLAATESKLEDLQADNVDLTRRLQDAERRATLRSVR